MLFGSTRQPANDRDYRFFVPAPPKPYVDPSVSPDGRFAAVSVQGPVQTIWIYDFARRTLAPITSSSLGSSQAPVWTP